jgi:ABC-type Na+ transport system ATPase subunit NatA
MGMLTAEFPPSAGDATLAGYSVTSEPEQTRRRIGTCAQENRNAYCFRLFLTPSLLQATVRSSTLILRT